MARLLWGVYATSTCSFYLRYVRSEKNSSDGVSRLDMRHIKFLLSQGWQQLHLPALYFSLDEFDPFAYQVAVPSICKQDQSCFSSCPWHQELNEQGLVSAEASPSFVSGSTSPSSLLSHQLESCLWLMKL